MTPRTVGMINNLTLTSLTTINGKDVYNCDYGTGVVIRKERNLEVLER